MVPRPILALFALLLTVVLAGCFQASPAHVQGWQSEAEAHGAMGLEATLGLEAHSYTVVGRGTLTDVGTPLSIHSTDTARAGPLVFFHGTVLGAGSGLIVLEGERIQVENGTLARLPVERVTSDGAVLRVDPQNGAPKDRPHMTIPAERPDVDTAWFFAVHTAIQARDLVVASAERATLISDGNETELDLPITFDADHLAIDAKGHIEMAEAHYHAASFAYAGDTNGGRVAPLDQPPIMAPVGVFGQDARLRLEAARIESDGPFRLIQALDDDASYVLQAELELRPHRDVIDVDAGNVSWVRVDYRERGYLAAAALENVTVSGPAAEFVRVPLERPPWMIEELFEMTSQTGWAAPLFALPVVFASPAIILGEALFTGVDCLLDDCPAEHPYPPWMGPGEIGRFYYQVDATTASPGTYPGTITISGANHAPITIDDTVQVA